MAVADKTRKKIMELRALEKREKERERERFKCSIMRSKLNMQGSENIRALWGRLWSKA